LEGTDNILRDNTVRFTTSGNIENYPSEIRRKVYYEPELKRTFTYYTNNFFLKAKDIAFLYKNRWAVETFFKWMKGHLRIESSPFGGILKMLYGFGFMWLSSHTALSQSLKEAIF
jgi:IS4 transposase